MSASIFWVNNLWNSPRTLQKCTLVFKITDYLTFVFPVLLLIFHCRSCFMFSHLSCGQYHRCHVRGWGKNNLQQPQTLSGSCQTCGVVSSIKVIAFYNLDLREVPQGKYWWKHWGLTPVGAVGQWVLQVARRSIRDMCKLHRTPAHLRVSCRRLWSVRLKLHRPHSQ